VTKRVSFVSGTVRGMALNYVWATTMAQHQATVAYVNLEMHVENVGSVTRMGMAPTRVSLISKLDLAPLPLWASSFHGQKRLIRCEIV
jgi:hypothetical protein